MNVLKASASGAVGDIPGASTVLTVYDTVKSFLTGISKSGGTAKPNVIQGSRTINSTPSGYNSNLNAVKVYIGTSSATGAYVSSVTITGIESKSVAKIYPTCPQFPAHIY